MGYTRFRSAVVAKDGFYTGEKGSETVVVSSAGAVTAAGNVDAKTFTGDVVALTPGTAITMNAALGEIFTLTPSTNATITVTNAAAGMKKVLAVTAVATSYVLTFSTVGALVNGTLATGTSAGKVFMMTFAAPSTTLIETSRTTAL